jgi:hypothetical protein
MYFQLANSMISECSELSEVSQISVQQTGNAEPSRHSRKADSGVSFNTTQVPNSRSNSIAEPVSPIETARPKTPSGGKHSSTLEKLARGLKTIGRSRTDVTEMISDIVPSPSTPPPVEKTKTLRKMRSMGAIEGRKRAEAAAAQHESFNPNEMRRNRLRYEAGAMASQKSGRNQSHEV